jgi:hypothetical protein
VDNNAHSWHYQQRMHVPTVPGSMNNQGGALAYNGIGGIFGVETRSLKSGTRNLKPEAGNPKLEPRNPNPAA